MRQNALERFLEDGSSEVMIGYKEPIDDIEVLLEDLQADDRYIVLDTFRNYTLERLKDITSDTVGEEHVYGVRNTLPGDRDTEHYRVVKDPGDLDQRRDAVSDLVVQDVMKEEPDPELVYVMDDIDNALGFREEEEMFRYAHSIAGSFMSMEGNTVLLANRGYSGILRNLADVEMDLSWQT